MILPDAPWRHKPGLDRLLAALGPDAARFVGGAVRDGLLGEPVKDVDIATIHAPEEVIARLRDVPGIKTVPTGIDHGTITAVIEGWPVEITTLRRDVSTDGRRATVAFSADWREDAARRDFTFNALYADPADGAITDYFGGVRDLEDRRVRFIGVAAERIAEDHLRILRFFRFHARFGRGEPDAEGYAACVTAANSLMALSRERVADELLKLLAVTDPAPTIGLMVKGGILLPVLPEIDESGVARLRALVAAEADAGIAASALRRLCALLPQDPAIGEAVAARLKLSNKARKRLAIALSPSPAHRDAHELAYRLGAEGAIDRLLLGEDGSPSDAATLKGWHKPTLPVSGGQLVARGLAAGPEIARALRMIEEQWIAEGFPQSERANAIADQIVSKFQRARQ
ncbi:CCA tRNA nucleotidyltransferase [Sphingobium sp. H39-3-25]|uniref:CCA tRNA nucleotidyltransferase n=1 Tax=Sphingobium arseniciresistens TaxID=3030834 RepID=UPI0023B9CF25|nr:CCA tRNA nucleotidyltransferase [Sphingobium arseniciresistens]